MKRSLPCLALFLLSMGCVRDLQHKQLTDIPLAEKPAIPSTESACKAAGQFWSEQGLPGGPKSCAVRTTDALKICTDSAQCQGSCLVAENLPLGVAAIGSCSAWVATFGCYKYIEGGRVHAMCAD
jgi:hypothetical protein